MAENDAGSYRNRTVELTLMLQLLRDENIIFSCEAGARGILQNSADPRRAQAERILQLRPLIRKRARARMPYGDLMEEFWRLVKLAQSNLHAGLSRPQNLRAEPEWAKRVAEWLAKRHSELSASKLIETIGNSYAPTKLAGDFVIYRDGKKIVVANQADKEELGALASGYFAKHYLRPALQQARSRAPRTNTP